jgi:phosphoribosyl 1,2-cyclic phosphodiesterase
MPVRISFLGSGSQGNATLVETPSHRFLLDIGLSLSRTREALADLGLELADLDHVILSHTHRDHVQVPLLNAMARAGVRLLCDRAHRFASPAADAFERLHEEGLVEYYAPGRFEVAPDLAIQPFPVPHDSPGTHGFLFDLRLGASVLRFAYLADCGEPLEAFEPLLEWADLIALEFNHDPELERASGRPARLVRRVLGPQGHLSNDQAAALLERARPPRSAWLVQLHISRDCNRPEIARRAARRVLPEATLHATCQDAVGPVLEFA